MPQVREKKGPKPLPLLRPLNRPFRLDEIVTSCFFSCVAWHQGADGVVG